MVQNLLNLLKLFKKNFDTRVLLAVCVVAFSLVSQGAALAAVNQITQTMVNTGTITLNTGDTYFVSTSLTLPANLTINGNGLAIEMRSGGQFNAPAAGATLTLNNVSFNGISTGNTGHVFYNNTVNATLTINIVGEVNFDGNRLTNAGLGSVIYNNGDVNVGTNSGANKINVTNNFTAGTTVAHGGAIVSYNRNIYIGNEDSIVDLSGNTTTGVAAVAFTRDDDADKSGNGDITINGSKINILDNSADIHSGALYTGREDANITIGNENSEVKITHNIAQGTGGAIQSAWGKVIIDGKNIEITNNHAQNTKGAVGAGTGVGGSSGGGGAIMASKGVEIGNDDSIVDISGNSAIGRGGAIYTSNKAEGYVTINGKKITLNNNAAGIGSTLPDTGGGAIYAKTDITLNGGEIEISENYSRTHGGALESETGNITINVNTVGSLLVDGNYTAVGDGGAFYTQKGNVTINAAGDSSFTDNEAGNSAGLGQAFSGGAIYAGSNVRIISTASDVAFEDNIAKGGVGGAIYAGVDVHLEASDGNIVFTDNKAGTHGGAVYAGEDVYLSDTTGSILFTGNRAGIHGGAIYADTGLIYLDGKMIELKNNTAETGSGGAIWAADGIILDDGGIKLSGNKAKIDGGAIWTDSDVVLEGGYIDLIDNIAETGSGGAIWAGGEVNLEANNGDYTFTGNEAGLEGGAIYAGKDAIVVARTADIAFESNKAGSHGGAISAVGNVYLEADGGNISFTGNEALGDGGAIRTRKNVTLEAIDGNILFEDNKADGSGGAIWANLDVTITSDKGDITFEGNKAEGEGGAIWAGNNVTLIAEGSGNIIFKDNVNVNTKTDDDPSGAIWAGGELNLIGSNIQFINNATRAGKDINISSDNMTEIIGGGLFTGLNVIIDANGGFVAKDNDALYIDGGAIRAGKSVELKIGVSGDITNNSAEGDGGAFWAGDKVTLNATGPVNLTGNEAVGAGGAIWAGGSEGITLTGTKFLIEGNTAGTSGGALYADSGDVTITGSTEAKNNTAGEAGGVIYAAGDVTLSATIGDIIFENNKAAGGSGGAIRAGGSIDLKAGSSSTTFSISALSDIVLNNNEATGDGGAFWAGTGISLAGRTITMNDNKAGGSGGALYTETGDVTITGEVEAKNNTAGADGGAIYAAGNMTLNATGDSTFEGNKAGAGTETSTGIVESPGYGGAIWAGGNVELNADGGDISFRGNEATMGDAIWLENNTNTASTATFATAAGRTIYFYDSIANNAANGLITVEKTGAGTVIFDGVDGGNDSPIYGATNVAQGVFVVRNDASYGELAANVYQTEKSSFMVNPGTILAGGTKGHVIADDFTLSGKLDISGSATLGSPAGNATGGYSEFAITGANQRFEPRSEVLFNTYLNDASTQLTDLLMLDLVDEGTATGKSSIMVDVTGGGGAITQGDGIMLVETANGTSTGAFVLGNRVAAGAYEYMLFQGGIDGNTANQNWYLRNTYTDPQEPPSYPQDPEPITPNVPPIYRPEVPVISVVPALASRMGLGILGTWHERRDGEFATNYTAPDGYDKPGWGRIFGDIGTYGMGYSETVIDRTNSFHKYGPSYDYWFAGIQAGVDLKRDEDEDDGSRDIAGIYFAAGTGRADVHSIIDFGFGKEAGRTSMQSFSLGAYYTRIAKEGGYVDAVLQGTYYANIKSVSYINEPENFKTDGYGLIASIEGGYPIRINGDDDKDETKEEKDKDKGWILEPQAQLVFQHLSFGGGEDRFGRIDFDNNNSLFGRLSLRLNKDWTNDEGKKSNVWGRASFWTDFGTQAKTTFSNSDGLNPVTINTDLGGNWLQFDLGIATEMRDDLTFFAVGNYSKSISNDGGHSWGGRIGLKYQW